MKAPAHGDAEMPVWGPLFSSMDQNQAVVDLRIANLTKYIKSYKRSKPRGERAAAVCHHKALFQSKLDLKPHFAVLRPVGKFLISSDDNNA